ncbi:hypothetical protein [Desulfonema magnum]|uniref:hypothetical protein n=1 Tax=Desulfonema magnum TaxID=45655 RepID=UPI001A9B3139|nr:hypothetical protein [Desulfonema magnum]
MKRRIIMIIKVRPDASRPGPQPESECEASGAPHSPLEAWKRFFPDTGYGTYMKLK